MRDRVARCDPPDQLGTSALLDLSIIHGSSTDEFCRSFGATLTGDRIALRRRGDPRRRRACGEQSRDRRQRKSHQSHPRYSRLCRLPHTCLKLKRLRQSPLRSPSRLDVHPSLHPPRGIRRRCIAWPNRTRAALLPPLPPTDRNSRRSRRRDVCLFQSARQSVSTRGSRRAELPVSSPAPAGSGFA
jgi:hypothetical protein